jgi:hypothetical protein
MATEISGYFTEKVPPKPQQASALGQLNKLNSAHLLDQPSRLAVHIQIAQGRDTHRASPRAR